MDEQPLSSEPVVARPVGAGPPAAPPPAAPHPMELMAIPRRSAALDLVLILSVTLLTPLVSQFTVNTLGADGSWNERPELRWSLVAHEWAFALTLLVLTLFLVQRCAIPAAAFGLQARDLGRQLLWSLAAFVGVYIVFVGLMLVVGLLTILVPGVDEDLSKRLEFMELLPLDDWTAMLLLLVGVAIFEELLFRGLLIPYLRRVGCGWSGAVLISSAVFGALHIDQGVLGIMQILGVGLVLGVFFVVSRSLIAVMVAHFLFNFCQFQVMRFMLPWLEQQAGPE